MTARKPADPTWAVVSKDGGWWPFASRAAALDAVADPSEHVAQMVEHNPRAERVLRAALKSHGLVGNAWCESLKELEKACAAYLRGSK